MQAATHELAARGRRRGRYADAFEAWLALGGADLEQRAESVLRDLGLDPALLDLETVALSGGQAARASLAAILLSRFDVLLLDEPTNDLDFDGLARLERFVAERPGGAVIVSHDRAFLERTVTRVLEIDEIAHTASEFGGGWAATRSCARPPPGTPRSATRATPPSATGSPTAPAASASGRRPASKAKASKGVGARQVDPPSQGRALREAGLEGARDREGDRAAGRSRSLAALGVAAALRRRRALGRRDRPPRQAACDAAASCSARSTSSWPGASGSRSSGPTAAARRRSSTGLLGELRFPTVRAGSAPGCGSGRSTRRARLRRRRCADRRVRRAERDDPAGRALAAGQVRARERRGGARARSLSPGERTRASLALLMASGANFLVLDEPTNHLDLPAIEQLETALDAYDGTLLLVTHDRQLLEAVELDRTIRAVAGHPLGVMPRRPRPGHAEAA